MTSLQNFDYIVTGTVHRPHKEVPLQQDVAPKKSTPLATWQQAVTRYFSAIAQRPVRSFALWSLWLSCLYFAFGPASYVKVVDAGNGTLPARMWEGDQLRQGSLGDWFPMPCCGSDRVLNAYRMELPSLLFVVLPGWLAYGAIMYLQRFLAGYFFFRLMRDDLRTSLAGAFFAGLAYSLFNQPGVHSQWDGFQLFEGFGVPCLPLLLWGIARLHAQRGLLPYAWAAIGGAALALSATYYQVLFFPILVLFWFVCIQRLFDWKMLALLTAMAAGWTVLQGPQILAASQFAPLSHRAGFKITSDSDWVNHIENVQIWAAIIFNSNLMLLLVGAAGLILSGFQERRLIWTLAAVAATLGFIQYYLFFSDHIFAHLGTLAGFHFHRVVILIPFLTALAAGLGIHAAGAGKRTIAMFSKRWRWEVSLATIVLVVAFGHLAIASSQVNYDRYKNMLHGESYELMYRHPDVLSVAALKNQLPPFRVASVIDASTPSVPDPARWTFSPGFAWAYNLETADGYLVLYSRRYKQYWSQVLAGLLKKDPILYQRHETWGNQVYLWKPTDPAVNVPFRDLYNLDLLSLANVRFIFSPVPLDDQRLKLMPSEFRDELTEWQKRHSAARVAGMLRGEFSWRPMYVYENREVLPRFLFAGEVRVCDGEKATLAALHETDSRHFMTEAIINRDDLGKLSTEQFHGDVGKVQLVSQNTDELELEVNCTGAGLVVVANTYSPNWRAEVDGQPTTIVPANYTFQGIPVEKGTHRVHLRYRGADRWASLWEEFTRPKPSRLEQTATVDQH